MINLVKTKGEQTEEFVFIGIYKVVVGAHVVGKEISCIGREAIFCSHSNVLYTQHHTMLGPGSIFFLTHKATSI